jgi:uncharacterized membrane protein
MGCEARKIRADAEVFFLDFYLYRTYQDLAEPIIAISTAFSNPYGGCKSVLTSSTRTHSGITLQQ